MNLFDCSWEEFEAAMANQLRVPLNIYRGALGVFARYQGTPPKEPGTRTLKSGAVVRNGKTASTPAPVSSAPVLETRTVGSRLTITRYA